MRAKFAQVKVRGYKIMDLMIVKGIIEFRIMIKLDIDIRVLKLLEKEHLDK
jgi:hypothetical protein